MRRLTATAAFAAVISVFGSALLALPSVAAPGESITVQVVRDVDGNGSQGPQDDTPVEGIQVTVEDSAGGSFSAVTDAAGSATFDLTTATGPYRVYSTIPATLDYLQPAPAGGVLAGETTYDPLVAFVDLAGGDSATVLQAVWNPYQWVQPDPLVLFTQQQEGLEPGTQRTSGYAQPDLPIQFPSDSTYADFTGSSLFGVAYDRFDDAAYYASFVRRNAGFTNDAGTGTNGTIYVKQDPQSLDGGAATVFAILEAGNTEHSDFPVDPDIFAVVGKEGLGDIQLSPDGSILYVVNLFDKQLYAISTDDPTVITSVAIPVPAGLAGREDDWRPFGLGYADGVLYVGGVDSAESLQQRSALRAYIWTFEDGAFGAAPIVDQSLDYLKGSVYANTGHVKTDAEQHWNPWKSTWDGIDGWGGDAGGDPIWLRYPQPMLTDIAVDVDGSLVLGFKDRTGAMGGPAVPAPDGSDQLYETMSGGDLIRVCKVGDAYVWECGVNNNVDGRGGPSQSPAVSEYYPGEWILNHEETAQGSAAYLPDGTLLATTIAAFRQTGWSLFDDETGASEARVPLVSDFQKAGGIGAVALIASAAIPVQLGNRTWFDTDGDGIQEPGDPDLPGVEVTLLDAVGNTVDTTITDADGLYYFNVPALQANTDYRVSFDYYNATFPAGVTVTDVEWTLPNVGADIQLQSRAVQTVVPQIAQTELVSLAPGEVNHTLDAGVRIIPVGTFTLQKVLDGITFDELLPGAEFVFTVTPTGGTPFPVTLSAGNTPTPFFYTSAEFPQGTEFTIVETGRDDTLPPGFAWVGDPVLTDGGVFTIGDGTTTAITAINGAQEIGSFTITKELGGSAAGSVPAGMEFQVRYTLDDEEFTIALRAGETFESGPVPVGTEVTVAEARPANSGGLVWSAPRFVVDGGSASESASFTIEERAQDVEVLLTNTVNAAPPMPVTGANSEPLLVAAGAALLIGLLAVIVGRRSRSTITE